MLLVAARGSLFPHPLYLPPGVGVTGFTPFHNLNCPYGFITALGGFYLFIHPSFIVLSNPQLFRVVCVRVCGCGCGCVTV